MIELGALVVFGVGMVAIVAAFATLVKAVLWVALLPIRLLFSLAGTVLMIPVLLVKTVLGGLLLLVAVPAIVVAAIAAFAAIIAIGTALLVPLIPIAFLLAVIWYLIRPEPHALVR